MSDAALDDPVIMDHDADMIRVVEGCGAAIECSIIEVPRLLNSGRSEFPEGVGNSQPRRDSGRRHTLVRERQSDPHIQY